MNPQADNISGVALSQPSGEQSVGTPMSPHAAGISNHDQTVDTQGLPSSSIPMPQPQAAHIPMGPSATSADDSQALDEEWVNKAKAIVEQTKNDPYMESRELGKVKADYLKIRFNKHINIVEEQQK